MHWSGTLCTCCLHLLVDLLHAQILVLREVVLVASCGDELLCTRALGARDFTPIEPLDVRCHRQGT